MRQHFNCSCTVKPMTLEEIQCLTSEQLQATVMELLNWSAEEYSDFFLDRGIAYLNALLDDDKDAIRWLQERGSFWTWFRNHWTYRDQAFIEAFMDDDEDFDPAFKASVYSDLHKAAVLACEIYPPRSVFGREFPTIQILAPCLK